MVTLQPLTLEECQQARVWRNDPAVLPMLRTGEKTEAEQSAFYRDVVCNAESEHRYVGLHHDGQFIGMGGLTYLFLKPGEGEISLILGPAFRGQGLGCASVLALLQEARHLRLRSVRGECYACGNIGFWRRVLDVAPHEAWTDASGSLCWVWWL